MNKFYISTPIYYVNGAPHIGHAYTTIVADAFARYYRLAGRDVFFQTGTDEHGLKIQRAAEAQGITPQELADLNSSKFRELFQKLDIRFDRFIRTTEDAHKQVVTKVVEKMFANDDVYLAKYEGWYSASDEAYYDETEIEDGKAKASGSPVEWVEEESYFFRLSRYTEPLLKWYRENPNCVQPEARRNEVMAFVEGGLKDLSISRTTFSWGIPLPNDPKHVLYVWVDALTNYITGVGAFQDEELYKRFWPCDVHLIGKDILRFHAVYWPAFLMSAGLETPTQVFAHGWWMNEGQKMSKSLGNFIDAFELAEEYEEDVLRYYLLREVPLGSDGNFVKARLIERNNAELADNIGNLVNRTLRMAQSYTKGQAPAPAETTEELDTELRKAAAEYTQKIDEFVEKRQLHLALEQLLLFSSALNQYVQSSEPWKLQKAEDPTRLHQVLYHALEGIRILGVLSAPFLPKASDKILEALSQNQPEDRLFTALAWGGLKEGTTLNKPEILFTKFDTKPAEEAPKKEEKKQEAKKEKKEKKEKKAEEPIGPIEFTDFLKVELRVVKIVTAERVEGAEKLLKLSIDAGEPEPRTVVAGIAKSFAPEELVGLHVAAVTNLKPAKLFGIPSQAMLLAADRPDGKVDLTRYSTEIKPGTRIR
ncbi:MAG: methionine--tRNA ligase [Myxococcales bacterium]|nr:methionine--tRNA ligase [Myxococcales bacterium]